MHEASLVEGIIKIAVDAVDSYKASNLLKSSVRVTEINCSAGLLTAIEEETLKACFEILAEGTCASGAVLNLERRALECQCLSCGENFSLTRRRFVCPFCKSDNIRFDNAAGLVITSINVDCEDANG